MRTNRSYLFRVFYRKGVRHHHLHLSEAPVHVETQMLVGKVYREKKKKASGVPYLQVVGPGKLAGGWGISCDWFGGGYLHFFGWP